MTELQLSDDLWGPADLVAGDVAAAVRERAGAPPAYPPALVARIDAAVLVEGAASGIRPSVLGGQINKETGYLRFGGQALPALWNLAGLGVTNGARPGEGQRFDGPEEGVRAVVAHHLLYRLGGVVGWPAALRARYGALARRERAVLAGGRAGKVRRFADFGNGTWAWTPRYPDGRPMPLGSLDNGYATGLVAYANHLRALSARRKGRSVAVESPPAVPAPSPNRNGYDGPRRVEAVVWHISERDEAGGLSWLRSPKSQVSCNDVIGRSGTVYELVPTGEDAWCNGDLKAADTTNATIARWLAEEPPPNPNQRTHSIEFIGRSSWGRGGSLAPAQRAAGVQRTAYILQLHGLPPTRETILGHRQINGIDKRGCPGFSDAEWAEMIGDVARLLEAGSAAGGAGSAVGVRADRLGAHDARLLLEVGQVAGRNPAAVGIVGPAARVRLRAGLRDEGLPALVAALVTEKVVLWTPDGERVDYFHRGQYEALAAAGHVDELR